MEQQGVGQVEVDHEAPPPRQPTLLEQMQAQKLGAELKYANEKIANLLSKLAQAAEKNDTTSDDFIRIISRSAIKTGDQLRAEMASSVGAKAAVAAAKAAVAAATSEESSEESSVGDARIAQMARQVEKLLYGGGAGNLERTRVLWAAVLERPAIRRLFNLDGPSEAKMVAAARASMAHAKQVLASLKTMGTRTKNDHLAFETILAALFPDNAKNDGLMRALQELLGVEWDPLHRAELSNEKADELGSFSAAVADQVARERRR